MELRDAIKVLDSDAHARDFDNDIRPYLPEPYRNQRASFIPGEHYDRNLGGTLGQGGAKVEERLAAMDVQQIDTAVMFPTSGLGVGRVREPQFQTAMTERIDRVARKAGRRFRTGPEGFRWLTQ